MSLSKKYQGHSSFDPGIPFHARPGDYPPPAELWERTGLAKPLASAAAPIAR